MYFILAASLAMTQVITGLGRHVPHATPLCHNKRDMN
jgi:hypothetical protein